MKIIKDTIVTIHPDKEFAYAFSYYIPSGIQQLQNAKILLVMHGSTIPDYENHTFFAKTYPELIEEKEAYFKNRIVSNAMNYDFIFMMIYLPRDVVTKTYPDGMRDCQAFTREVMVDKYIKNTEDNFYIRPDLKILDIIDTFQSSLKENNYSVAQKILLMGGSAGGNAANRFTILHPDRVHAVNIMIAGDFLYPVNALDEEQLEYPFGLHDFDSVDESTVLPQLQQIPHLIMVGDKEENHPLAYELLNDQVKIKFIESIFGKTPFERTKHFVKFLVDNNVCVELKIYYGSGHAIPVSCYKYTFNYFSNICST